MKNSLKNEQNFEPRMKEFKVEGSNESILLIKNSLKNEQNFKHELKEIKAERSKEISLKKSNGQVEAFKCKKCPKTSRRFEGNWLG